jgi:cytochrome b561
MVRDPSQAPERYSPAARRFHWLTVLLVAVQLPLGYYMTYRGYELEYVAADGVIKKGLFDATTGFLYDSHKLIGLAILAVVVLRLMYRLTAGAPRAEPTVPKALVGISHLTHWLLYLLLLAVPVGGYLGVSYFGATQAFGLPIPAVVAKDQEMSKEIFALHAIGAMALAGLVALHVLAAFYHRFVRKDGVLARMLKPR